MLGGLKDFAALFCDILHRSSGFPAVIADRDTMVAAAGPGKRELIGKRFSAPLAQLAERRNVWRPASAQEVLTVSDEAAACAAAVAAPMPQPGRRDGAGPVPRHG